MAFNQQCSRSVGYAISLGLTSMAVVLGMPGCAGYEQFVRDQEELPFTDGTMEAWGEVGNWSFRAQNCTSGAHEGFNGVTFYSEDKAHAVRLVRNAIGPMTVAVNLPGQGSEFAPLTCGPVKADFEPTGVRVNHIPVLRGTIKFSCVGLRGAAVFTCS